MVDRVTEAVKNSANPAAFLVDEGVLTGCSSDAVGETSQHLALVDQSVLQRQRTLRLHFLQRRRQRSVDGLHRLVQGYESKDVNQVIRYRWEVVLNLVLAGVDVLARSVDGCLLLRAREVQVYLKGLLWLLSLFICSAFVSGDLSF